MVLCRLRYRGVEGSTWFVSFCVDRQRVVVNSQLERTLGYERTNYWVRRSKFLLPERFWGKVPSCSAAERRNGFPIEISLGSLETPEGTFGSTAIRDITDRKKN